MKLKTEIFNELADKVIKEQDAYLSGNLEHSFMRERVNTLFELYGITEEEYDIELERRIILNLSKS